MLPLLLEPGTPSRCLTTLWLPPALEHSPQFSYLYSGPMGGLRASAIPFQLLLPSQCYSPRCLNSRAVPGKALLSPTLA